MRRPESYPWSKILASEACSQLFKSRGSMRPSLVRGLARNEGQTAKVFQPDFSDGNSMYACNQQEWRRVFVHDVRRGCLLEGLRELTVPFAYLEILRCACRLI